MPQDTNQFNAEFLIGEFKEALKEKENPFQSEKRFSDPEFLAEGGCKRLYTMTDSLTERVIVKAVPKNEDPETTAEFAHEAQLLASLQHPNILPVYDVGSDEDGTPFMLMKHLEGKSLIDHLKGKSLEEKLDIFGTICDAVAYTHNSEICHMDLKPDNIRISGFGDITICDWGSARRNNSKMNTKIGATPGYMAPEVFHGETGPLCDIYSLGCILFEIITGKRLYPQKKLKDIIAANKAGKCNLSAVKDPSLRAICAAALNKNTAERVDSATSLFLRIDLYNKKMPVPEENAGSLRRIRLLLKRRPALISSMAMFMVILAVVSLYSAYIFNKQKKVADQQRNLANLRSLEADQQREVASKKQLEAESLLKKYLTEKKNRETLSKKHGNTLYQQALQAFQMYRHKEAAELLELSITAAGENQDKLLLHGKLEMIDYRPAAARKTFEKAGRLIDYAPYLKMIPERDKLRKLSAKDQCEIIFSIRKVHSFFYHHFSGSIFTDPKISDKKKEYFINLLNAKFGHKRPVKVSDGGRTLKISDAGNYPVFLLIGLRLRKLDFTNCKSFPINEKVKDINQCYDLEEIDFTGSGFTHFFLIKHLKLRKLTLPSRKISRFDHVQHFPLEELNMGKAQVSSLKPLLSITTLKKVIMPESMKKLSGFKELSSRVSIIFKKK